jgi:hypothetical protein
VTNSLGERGAAGIAAGFALGIAVPVAAAKPIDLVAGGSVAPASWTPPPAASVDRTAGQLNGDGIPGSGYVVIGSGVTSLAVISVGGARICQQGLQFFPDRLAALAELRLLHRAARPQRRRVLRTARRPEDRV